jgi:hypothetical protein
MDMRPARSLLFGALVFQARWPLKKVKTWLAADEHRSTPIENKWFIRVHRRLSAAQNCFSASLSIPLGRLLSIWTDPAGNRQLLSGARSVFSARRY